MKNEAYKECAALVVTVIVAVLALYLLIGILLPAPADAAPHFCPKCGYVGTDCKCFVFGIWDQAAAWARVLMPWWF